MIRKGFSAVTMIVLTVLAIILSGCSETTYISGTITFGATTGPTTCRVYLADNSGTDFSNGGYIKRSVYNITETTTSVDYIIDTTDVPAGGEHHRPEQPDI